MEDNGLTWAETIMRNRTPGDSPAGALDASDAVVLPTGASTARTMAAHLSDVVNVKDFGATGDGTTDDTAAIQAAINTAKAVRFPKGTYKVTGLAAVAGGALLANRDATISLAVGSTVALTITAHNVTVRGLRFDGGNVGPYNVNTATVGTRCGISIPSGSVYGVHIEDCYCTGFDGAGLRIASTAQASGGDTGLPAVNVTGVTACVCFDGIRLESLGEYVQITNCDASYCNAGIKVSGGNNRVVNSHFSKCYRNCSLAAGTNGHHGSFIGCSFNHTPATGGCGVYALDVRNGHTFSGCHFWYADIILADTGGIMITGSQIGQSAINTAYTGVYNAGINRIVGNWLFGTIPLTFNASIPLVWQDNTLDSLPGVISTLTYGPTVTPNAALSEHIAVTATDGNAFTVANPINATPGRTITIHVRNASGGALGAVTWGADYKMAAFVAPATGFGRMITFRRWSIYWYEISRTPADVPN